jgi:hypothetical protein
MGTETMSTVDALPERARCAMLTMQLRNVTREADAAEASESVVDIDAATAELRERLDRLVEGRRLSHSARLEALRQESETRIREAHALAASILNAVPAAGVTEYTHSSPQPIEAFSPVASDGLGSVMKSTDHPFIRCLDPVNRILENEDEVDLEADAENQVELEVEADVEIGLEGEHAIEVERAIEDEVEIEVEEIAPSRGDRERWVRPHLTVLDPPQAEPELHIARSFVDEAEGDVEEGASDSRTVSFVDNDDVVEPRVSPNSSRLHLFDIGDEDFKRSQPIIDDTRNGVVEASIVDTASLDAATLMAVVRELTRNGATTQQQNLPMLMPTQMAPIAQVDPNVLAAAVAAAIAPLLNAHSPIAPPSSPPSSPTSSPFARSTHTAPVVHVHRPTVRSSARHLDVALSSLALIVVLAVLAAWML